MVELDIINEDKLIIFKKLNQDDILEIIIEHFWKNECKNLLNGKAAVFGTKDEDLRAVCVFGDLDDSRIDKWDMVQLDKELEFNGDHSFLENNPEFYLTKIKDK